ncbi:SPOR domain-containing protein [Parabacteroides sp. OttesenSCG-928-G07]|nr:SPOR domain-containing protein [Parabacteroides sp. OttesenSCG-928-G07]
MKHLLRILVCVSLFLLTVPHLQAQQSAQNGNISSIFDALNQYSFGKGEVIINQSDELRNLVGVRKHGANVEEVDGESYLKLQGFRLQVYSGNNQRTSKDEAFNKEQEIKDLFPDVSTYVTYAAPFWRLRVGDFRSHEEAYHLKLDLTKAFPVYAKEMYIVREEIRIPLY